MVQLSHPYMSTGKTIALTRWTFVGITTIIQYLWFKPRMSGNKSISSSDVAGTTVLFTVQNCKIINVFLFFVFLKMLDSVGEGKGGMFRENSIETCILSRVKQITIPGWMHETSARAWCTGKTQMDGVEREVGGGIGMGNTCISMADSCQCMTKPTTTL